MPRSQSKKDKINNRKKGTVAIKQKYKNKLEQKHAEYLDATNKYKADSIQWSNANKLYNDSLALYNNVYNTAVDYKEDYLDSRIKSRRFSIQKQKDAIKTLKADYSKQVKKINALHNKLMENANSESVIKYLEKTHKEDLLSLKNNLDFEVKKALKQSLDIPTKESEKYWENFFTKEYNEFFNNDIGYQLKKGKNKYEDESYYPKKVFIYGNMHKASENSDKDYKQYLDKVLLDRQKELKNALKNNKNYVFVKDGIITTIPGAKKDISNIKKFKKLIDNEIKPIGYTSDFEQLSYPVYKKPTHKPIPPEKPSVNNIYEDIHMRSAWPYLSKLNPNYKIGTLNPLEYNNDEKGFTLKEAVEYLPKKVKDFYNIDYMYNQINKNNQYAYGGTVDPVTTAQDTTLDAIIKFHQNKDYLNTYPRNNNIEHRSIEKKNSINPPEKLIDTSYINTNNVLDTIYKKESFNNDSLYRPNTELPDSTKKLIIGSDFIELPSINTNQIQENPDTIKYQPETPIDYDPNINITNLGDTIPAIKGAVLDENTTVPTNQKKYNNKFYYDPNMSVTNTGDTIPFSKVTAISKQKKNPVKKKEKDHTIYYDPNISITNIGDTIPAPKGESLKIKKKTPKKIVGYTPIGDDIKIDSDAYRLFKKKVGKVKYSQTDRYSSDTADCSSGVCRMYDIPNNEGAAVSAQDIYKGTYTKNSRSATKSDLLKKGVDGQLVFFKEKGSDKITHVGVIVVDNNSKNKYLVEVARSKTLKLDGSYITPLKKRLSDLSNYKLYTADYYKDAKKNKEARDNVNKFAFGGPIDPPINAQDNTQVYNGYKDLTITDAYPGQHPLSVPGQTFLSQYIPRTAEAERANATERSFTNAGNAVADFGTGLATMYTQFRRPTHEEYEIGRNGSWQDRAGFLAENASSGLVNTMLPKATELLAKEAAIGIANGSQEAYRLYYGKVKPKINFLNYRLGDYVEKRLGNIVDVENQLPKYNSNLQRGMGIKKVDVPIELSVDKSMPYKNLDAWGNERTTVDVHIDGLKSGEIQLGNSQRPRSFTEIVRGKPPEYDHPAFTDLKPGLSVKGAYTFSNMDGYKDLGIHSEILDAIHKENQIYSGANGLTNDSYGLWEKKVKRGQADRLYKGVFDETDNVYRLKPRGSNIAGATSLIDKEKQYKMLQEMKPYTNKEVLSVIDDMKARLKTPEGTVRKDAYPRKINFDKIHVRESADDWGAFANSFTNPKTGELEYYITLHPSLSTDKARKILRHEVEHYLTNNEPTYMSEGLKELESRNIMPYHKLSSEGMPGALEPFKHMLGNNNRALAYFRKRGEDVPILSELQQYMMDKGYLPKTDFSTLATPEMIEKVYNEYSKKAVNSRYPLRVFNVHKPNKKNFGIISERINELLGGATVVGTGVAINKNKYAMGGPEDPPTMAQDNTSVNIQLPVNPYQTLAEKYHNPLPKLSSKIPQTDEQQRYTDYIHSLRYKIGNEIIDNTTNTLSWLTTLSPASQGRLEANRKGLMNQLGYAADAASTLLLYDMMGPAAGATASGLLMAEDLLKYGIKKTKSKILGSDLLFKLGPGKKLVKEYGLNRLVIPKTPNTLKYLQQNKTLPIKKSSEIIEIGEKDKWETYWYHPKTHNYPKEFIQVGELQPNWKVALDNTGAEPIMVRDGGLAEHNMHKHFKRDFKKGYIENKITGYVNGDPITPGIAKHYNRLIKNVESRVPNAKVFGSAKLVSKGLGNKLPDDLDLYQFQRGDTPTIPSISFIDDGHGMFEPDLGFPVRNYKDPVTGLDIQIDRVSIGDGVKDSNLPFLRRKDPKLFWDIVDRYEKTNAVGRSIKDMKANKIMEEVKDESTTYGSFLDLFESEKEKHISRARTIWNKMDNPSRNKLQRDLINTTFKNKPKLSTGDFTNPADNKKIMEALGFEDYEESLLKDPESMKRIVDHYIIGETVFNRTFNDDYDRYLRGGLDEIPIMEKLKSKDGTKLKNLLEAELGPLHRKYIKEKKLLNDEQAAIDDLHDYYWELLDEKGPDAPEVIKAKETAEKALKSKKYKDITWRRRDLYQSINNAIGRKGPTKRYLEWYLESFDKGLSEEVKNWGENWMGTIVKSDFHFNKLINLIESKNTRKIIGEEKLKNRYFNWYETPLAEDAIGGTAYGHTLYTSPGATQVLQGSHRGILQNIPMAKWTKMSDLEKINYLKKAKGGYEDPLSTKGLKQKISPEKIHRLVQYGRITPESFTEALRTFGYDRIKNTDTNISQLYDSYPLSVGRNYHMRNIGHWLNTKRFELDAPPINDPYYNLFKNKVKGGDPYVKRKYIPSFTDRLGSFIDATIPDVLLKQADIPYKLLKPIIGEKATNNVLLYSILGTQAAGAYGAFKGVQGIYNHVKESSLKNAYKKQLINQHSILTGEDYKLKEEIRKKRSVLSKSDNPDKENALHDLLREYRKKRRKLYKKAMKEASNYYTEKGFEEFKKSMKKKKTTKNK